MTDPATSDCIFEGSDKFLTFTSAGGPEFPEPLHHELVVIVTRPSDRWISSTATYKPHLALISALMLERDRKSGQI